MFSADRGHTVAIQSGRRASVEGLTASRPLALPALAAAVHVASNAASNAAQAARTKLAARTIRPFVHEDQPTD